MKAVEIVEIARCPIHGLHGDRTECFECGGPVEQVAMVEVGVLGEALDLLALWYSRFQGFTAGTPESMVTRTTRMLTEGGRPPKVVLSAPGEQSGRSTTPLGAHGPTTASPPGALSDDFIERAEAALEVVGGFNGNGPHDGHFEYALALAMIAAARELRGVVEVIGEIGKML